MRNDRLSSFRRPDRDRRRRLVQLPPWRLMAARNTLEEHAALLELQKRVVPVQTAPELTYPVENPCIRLRGHDRLILHNRAHL